MNIQKETYEARWIRETDELIQQVKSISSHLGSERAPLIEVISKTIEGAKFDLNYSHSTDARVYPKFNELIRAMIVAEAPEPFEVVMRKTLDWEPRGLNELKEILITEVINQCHHTQFGEDALRYIAKGIAVDVGYGFDPLNRIQEKESRHWAIRIIGNTLAQVFPKGLFEMSKDLRGEGERTIPVVEYFKVLSQETKEAAALLLLFINSGSTVDRVGLEYLIGYGIGLIRPDLLLTAVKKFSSSRDLDQREFIIGVCGSNNLVALKTLLEEALKKDSDYFKEFGIQTFVEGLLLKQIDMKKLKIVAESVRVVDKNSVKWALLPLKVFKEEKKDSQAIKYLNENGFLGLDQYQRVVGLKNLTPERAEEIYNDQWGFLEEAPITLDNFKSVCDSVQLSWYANNAYDELERLRLI